MAQDFGDLHRIEFLGERGVVLKGSGIPFKYGRVRFLNYGGGLIEVRIERDPLLEQIESERRRGLGFWNTIITETRQFFPVLAIYTVVIGAGLLIFSFLFGGR